jgi:hypothetical protein
MSDEKNEIMEVKNFVDMKGREVRQFRKISGKQESFFKGGAIAVIQQRLADGRVIPSGNRPFEFVFPEGTKLEQAFEIFDEEAKKALSEIQRENAEQAAKNRIVPAGVMPQILGPTGKKVGG